ncbi:DUF452 family protein [Marinilabiliaceae bacterium JC040]|nr:DUF452 family protein [Marinilabiliaceae bacterium JC040]
MKYKFVDNNSDRLIVFFNGWGMDSNVLNSINGDFDVLIYWDYRGDLELPFKPISSYSETYLVAWSMGVYIANELAENFDIKFIKKIALCGSPYPIHNDYGIKERIFEITCKGLRRMGTDKFFAEIFASNDDSIFNKPSREFEEQVDELENLEVLVNKYGTNSDFKWNSVLIAEKDTIFSMKNLLNYWKGNAEVTIVNMPHYPFDKYNSWEQIIAI